MKNKENVVGKIKTLFRFSKAETSSADISEGVLNTFASSSVDSDQTQGYFDLSNYVTDSDSSLSLNNQSNSTSVPTWSTWSTTRSTWPQSWPSTLSIPIDNSYKYEEFLESLENHINDKLEEIEDKVKDLLSMIKENPKDSNSLYPLMQYQIGQKESLLNISKYIKENKERISL